MNGKVFQAGVWLVLVAGLFMVYPAWADEAVENQESPRWTPALFPPMAQGKAAEELAMGIVARANAELYATNRYNHLHTKQVLSMARHHGYDGEKLADLDVARKAAKVLNVKRAGSGKLTAKKGGGWTYDFVVFATDGDRKAYKKVELPTGTAAAVKEGGHALAEAMAALDGVTLATGKTLHPETDSDKAMKAYLSCYATLIRQPMGIRNPAVIADKKLQKAVNDCEIATKADKYFYAAWAAQSLAYSLQGKDRKASVALVPARDARGYLPFYYLARYWLITRYRTGFQGAQVMRVAVQKHPGSLIYKTYLGEHLNVTRQYKEALSVWEDYLQQFPGNAFAMANKGYALARLGRMSESIEISEKAVEADPMSDNIKLELASRYVDAARLDDAQKLLEPLAKKKNARGELLLRLGYVYLLKKQNKKAEKLLKRALKVAKGPAEWRTRGRTKYDLAILAVRKKQLKRAEKYLLQADKEGFKMATSLKFDPDLLQLSQRKAVKHLFIEAGIGETSKNQPKQATPFPVGPGGELRPNGLRPQEPEELKKLDE